MRVVVSGRPIPGGGGREDPCCDIIGIGAKADALSKTPLPIPAVPQTFPLPAEGHGEKPSLLPTIGERPNGCCLRSPGDEKAELGARYGDETACWNGARVFAFGDKGARGACRCNCSETDRGGMSALSGLEAEEGNSILSGAGTLEVVASALLA